MNETLVFVFARPHPSGLKETNPTSISVVATIVGGFLVVVIDEEGCERGRL